MLSFQPPPPCYNPTSSRSHHYVLTAGVHGGLNLSRDCSVQMPSLKNRQASELEGAPQSRSSTYESSVRDISSTSKTSTMSS